MFSVARGGVVAATIVACRAATRLDGSKDNENLRPWIARWDKTDVTKGWQLEEPHPLLVEHASRLLPPRAAAHRVLVPLCGKDVSLTYLAKYGRGALPSPRKEGATTEGGGAAVGTEVTTAAGARVGQVVGVEGAAQAIREFAAEHPAFGVPAPLQDSKVNRSLSFADVAAEVLALQGADVAAPWAKEDEALPNPGAAAAAAGSSLLFSAHASEDGTLVFLLGDFFGLSPACSSPPPSSSSSATAALTFSACWDRGSLVAIEPAMRQRYAQVLASLMEPRGRVLLVALDRRAGSPGALAAGPPYGVSEAAARGLFEGDFEVRVLSETAMDLDLPENARFRKAGVEALYEMAFLLERKEATTATRK